MLRLVLVLLLVAIPLPLGAAPQVPVIKIVTVDSTVNTVTITGENLGNGTPTVRLAGTQLVVDSFNPLNQTIVAFLPGVLDPGTYLLTVSVGAGSNNRAEADITIGAAPLALPFQGSTAASEAFSVTNNLDGGVAIVGVAGVGGDGVRGIAAPLGGGAGVHGISQDIGVAIVGTNLGGGPAGRFDGNVLVRGDLEITGNLSKRAGTFKIDHPLDPKNKTLAHSFVESPDMLNIYNGNVTLDADGEAWIELPAWFEALNRDFRYQLTALGAPGPNLHVAQTIAGNRFKIAGGMPRRDVSWQVTGIRHDPYANAHRIRVEEDKTGDARGRYLHPQAYGVRD